MTNGQDGPSHPLVAPPLWSSAGRLAYVVAQSKRGPFSIVLDGSIGAPLANLGQITPSASIAFTPDGQSVVAAAMVDGAWRPIVGDRIGPGYEGVGMIHIDDGRVVSSAIGADAIRHVSTAV